jgi:hypothetical protein
MAASRAHADDPPGPHPENQLKRRELRGARHALLGVLVVVAGLAIAKLLGAGPPMRYLTTGTLAVLAASQTLAAVAIASHRAHARMVALAAALVVVAWGVWQVIVWNDVTWFQVALLGTGSFEALLVAGCTPRGHVRRRGMFA